MVALTRFKNGIPLLVLGIVGCAPLQQAPLVYSSKVTVGIDVSGTTTEQPGVSINVGYKQVDAAYVPVAVAKPCESKETGNQPNCTDPIYQLKQIEGKNKVGDSEVPKSALEAAQKRISEFKQISQARDSAEAELAKAISRRDDAQKLLQTLVADKKDALKAADEKNVADLTPAETLLIAERQKKTTQLADENTAVAKAEAQRKKADEAFNNANVTGLVEAYGLVGGENNKTDAYSVFGSFDANTKAGAETGGSTTPKGEVALVIGKVFSTGVASQFLTEGMRGYYAGMGAAQVAKAKTSCLTVGENYISEYKKTLNLNDDADKKKLGALLERIAETCSKLLDDVAANIAVQLKEAKK